MHYFLAVFFFILGTAGLILRNNTGVFAGLGLFPLEMVKISGGKRVGIVFIIVSTLTGAAYFALQEEWLVMLLFIFVQSLNSSVYYKESRKEEGNEQNGE